MINDAHIEAHGVKIIVNVSKNHANVAGNYRVGVVYSNSVCLCGAKRQHILIDDRFDAKVSMNYTMISASVWPFLFTRHTQHVLESETQWFSLAYDANVEAIYRLGLRSISFKSA